MRELEHAKSYCSEGFVIGRIGGWSSSIKGKTWTLQDGRRVWK